MGKSKQILLVFSDLTAAELLKKNLLVPTGHEVEITSNQENAKKTIELNCPNLLILNDEQEGINSQEFIAYLLKKEPTLPIILLSNKSSEIKTENFIHAGYVDIINSPYKKEKLQNAISLGLQRNENWLNWLNTVSKPSEGISSTLVLDQLENGVVAFDEQGKITVLNQGVRKAQNLLLSEQVGKSIDDVFLDTSWLEILKGDYPPSEILEVIGANEKVYQVKFSKNDTGGKIVSFFDITQLKELYSLKTDFVNNVAHDLRSPLTSIFGYIDLIQRVGVLNEEQQEYINKVNISAHKINSMIDKILSLGKAQVAKNTEMKMLAIYPIIQNSVDDLLIQAKNRNQTLDFTYDEQLPEIPGDPIQLRQMIDNLIGNAIKYTQDGGAISVSVICKKEIISIKVEDNGVGVPKEEYLRIFEKFYRSKEVDHATPGTGLGLAIAKSVVDNHHGRIKVESELGKGTTFIVLLPAFR